MHVCICELKQLGPFACAVTGPASARPGFASTFFPFLGRLVLWLGTGLGAKCTIHPQVVAHATHALFVVGGFAVCWRCGGATSAAPGTSYGKSLLATPCRGWVAEGSKGRLRQFTLGRLPQTYARLFGNWPDGRGTPQDVRWPIALRHVHGAWQAWNEDEIRPWLQGMDAMVQQPASA